MQGSSEGTSSVVTFDTNNKSSTVAALSNQILVAAVVFFTVTAIFVLLLYIMYVRWRRRVADVETTGAFVEEIAVATTDNGLHLHVIKSLPVVVFQSEEFRDGMECAVCMSEVVDGEKARLLPICNHGFHLECIDMWLFSHSTCPICRNPLGAAEPDRRSEETDQTESESVSLPTNVLFWGNGSGEVQEAQTSTPTSSSPPPPRPPLDEMPVIEIQRRVTVEGSVNSNEETNPKIPTQVSTRLGSFRRLLGREKRSMGFGCSCPGGVIPLDVEQGI